MISSKRTKRDENRIILWVMLFSFLTVLLTLFIFFYILPGIEEVEEIKKETYKLSKELKSYEDKWISLEALKKTIKDWSLELDKKINKDYVTKVLEDVDADFYKKNLENNKPNKTYKEFIEEKEKEYKDASESTSNKTKLTLWILPIYSDTIKEEWSMTDFQFINYIESIVSTFNLSFNNSIWIKELKQIDKYSLSNSDNTLDKAIFEIPIELDIVWRKSSIIDFLHFIENVWKISIDPETNELTIDKETAKNGDLFSEFKIKKLDWQRNHASKDYNIYNNQIIDIENILMTDYIDSSEQNMTFEDTKSFLKYLKSTQDKEKFEAKIKLNFYVKWLPKYKVEQLMAEFNNKINDLEKRISKAISKTTLSATQKQRLTNLQSNIKNIKNSVAQANNTKGIMDRYQNISWYSGLLTEYEEELKKLNI